VYDDQWWQLVPGTGSYAGCYVVKSNYTGKVIFSRSSPDPRVGHIDGNGEYADNWFTIEAGTGKNANNFRLRNKYTDSDTVMFSRTTPDPKLYNYPGNSDIYDDQYFTYLFEDMKIDRIEYHVDQALIVSSVPEVIGQETERNDTDVNQTVEFDFSKALTLSSSFEYTLGFTIAVGTTIEAGLPGVVGGQVKVDASVTNTFKWGSITTEGETYAIKFSATAPPHTQVTGVGTVTCCNIDVPYTVYSSSVATGFQVMTTGTYHGVTFWDIQSDTTQKAL